jgi:hypothetical protein
MENFLINLESFLDEVSEENWSKFVSCAAAVTNSSKKVYKRLLQHQESSLQSKELSKSWKKPDPDTDVYSLLGLENLDENRSLENSFFE